MAFLALKKYFETPVAVTNVSQLVLAENPQRKYCILINDSNQNIYLRFGSHAALNEGIAVYAAGFAYEITKDNLWVGDIFAIHGGAGTKNLLIIEMS